MYQQIAFIVKGWPIQEFSSTKQREIQVLAIEFVIFDDVNLKRPAPRFEQSPHLMYPMAQYENDLLYSSCHEGRHLPIQYWPTRNVKGGLVHLERER